MKRTLDGLRAALVCAVLLPLSAYLWRLAIHEGQMRELVQAEIRHQADGLRDQVLGDQPSSVKSQLLGDGAGSVKTQLFGFLQQQASGLRADASSQIRQGLVVTQQELSATRGAALILGARLDARVGALQETVEQMVSPVSRSATHLMDSYASDNLAKSDEWRAIKPEITCRNEDGTGKGDCIHSRVSGLLGEALRVGGVFTQNFPTLIADVKRIANSFADIATDVQDVTHSVDQKYFHPPQPKGFWGKFWARLKQLFNILEAFGLAAVRSGVL